MLLQRELGFTTTATICTFSTSASTREDAAHLLLYGLTEVIPFSVILNCLFKWPATEVLKEMAVPIGTTFGGVLLLLLS